MLAENAGRWESASPRDLARVEAIARAVMSRLLHEPTIRLRSLGEDRGHASLELVRELFGLREDAAVAGAIGEAGGGPRPASTSRALMRIGTRRSVLALAQARLVADRLEIGQQGGCEIVPVATSGDSGAAGQDKSRWVAELEDALLEGKIDVAVHSAKDVPGELAEGLSLLGAPARASVQDVLCGADGLDRLDLGARVGTSSVRRAAQLRSAREDLDVVGMRGNVDTRLRKLSEGEFDAIVLARAGLQRLRMESEIGARARPRALRSGPRTGQPSRSRDAPTTTTRAPRCNGSPTRRRSRACLQSVLWRAS